MADTSRGDQQGPLTGRRILVIEDEFFIADDIKRVLASAGAVILGPISTFDRAQAALADGTFDCAVLDLNLHGESAIPIADQFLSEGQSFIIATGYGSPAVPERFSNVPRVEKPYDPEVLVGILAKTGRAQVG